MKRSSNIEAYHDLIEKLYPEDFISNFTLPDSSSIVAKGKMTRTVTFQVTEDCNLRCTYCYQTNKSKHHMSFDVAKTFIDGLFEGKYKDYIGYENSPAIIIEFIGGEPLLEIDLISQICDYFIDKCLELNHPWLIKHMFNICSNGVLYKDPRVQSFMKKHRYDLSFSISIDGNKKLHNSCRVFPDGSGSYDIAIAGVHHYRENYNPNIGSKMTLAPSNIEYTSEAVISLINDGYRDVFLNCVFEEGWTYDHATILYHELVKLADYILDHKDLTKTLYLSIFDEKAFCPQNKSNNSNWCGGTGSMTAIDYKGDIYPCIRYMDSSLHGAHPPIIIGNVYDGVLVTKEQRDTVKYMNSITRISQSTEECINCPIGEGCAWCSAYNYQVFGTVNKRATFICVMHKARALANAYYWNKLYLSSDEENHYQVFKNYLSEEESLKIITKDEYNMIQSLQIRDDSSKVIITNTSRGATVYCEK